MNKLREEAQLSICRVSNMRGDGYISLQVTDAKSGVRFLDLEVQYADFTEALTGMGYTPCTMRLMGLDKVGKSREVKHEKIPRPKGLKQQDVDAVTTLLAPYEVDGWKADHTDLFNHHRCSSRGIEHDVYLVGFVRFVDDSKEPT